jgi:homoserine kinase
MKKLTLRIPGSTSNLGPGLDTVGLALGIYCRLTFTLLEKEDPAIPFVKFKGPISTASLPSDTEALIKKVLRKLWEDDPDLLKRTRITIDSDIPLGVGLGSSDATIIGALWAAYAFRDIVPTPATMLAEAAKLEGHGENMAASLLGEFVVCMSSSDGGQLIARNHPWPSKWKTILLVPAYRAKTAEARALLPVNVPMADAIANVQRASMLVSAVTTSHDIALKEALSDHLHERYRQAMSPLLTQVRRLLEDEPVFGTVLSGGGPSVLVIVHEKHKPQVMEKLSNWAAAQSDPPKVLDLPVDTEGIKELGQPGRPPSSG